MTTNLVFIHGMGTFTSCWSKPVVAALDQAAETHHYAAFNGKPPSAQVDRVVELLYDPYLVATLEAGPRWRRT